MPTVKQLAVIAIAIAAAIVGAGTVGIEHSATQEHSVTQVLANRFTPSKADFRLNDPQRLRKILLGQEHIELPLR
jgi:NADH dehydrogenase FAD-containing subunit